MKSSVKSLGNCQVKLTVTLTAEEVQAIVKDVEKKILRESQIPGFRKGKAPLNLVQKAYAPAIEEETRRVMFRQNYDLAVQAEKLEEPTLTNIEKITTDENGGSFEVLVEVKPTFKLPTYKGLKVELRDPKVDDATVTAQVESIRAMYASYNDAQEGAIVEEGDFVQIDYEGMIGEKKILEINPEAKMVAGAKGFWLQLLEGRFVPELMDAMKGMKIGETKEKIEVKFAKEGAPEGLAGKKATYTITVTALRKRQLPDDATFVEKMKSESIEKIVSDTRELLEKNAVEAEAKRREQEVIECLLKKADFDVPPSQLARMKDSLLRDFAQRAQYSGLDANYFEKNAEKIKKDAEEIAMKQLRLYHILNAVAAAENITCPAEERNKKAMDFILANVKK